MEQGTDVDPFRPCVCTEGAFHADENRYNKVAVELNWELRRLRVNLFRRLYPYV